MNNNKQTLSRRIINAFTYMTVAVSSVFAISIMVTVHFVEQYLISDELLHELEPVTAAYERTKIAPALDNKEVFYVGGSETLSPPAHYMQLDNGFNEVVDPKGNYYVYIIEHNGVRYYLEKEQNDFEQHEQILYLGVLISLFLSILVAWYVGTRLARSIISPVTKLANQVSNRDQIHASTPDLAQEYANDEIGNLAQSFDNTFKKLRMALMRESLYTSDVSHELRTPLMVISSSADLLLAGENLSVKDRLLIERIDTASTEIRDLVRVFQMLARSEKNETADLGLASIEEVLEKISPTWQERTSDKGLSFEIQYEGQNNLAVNSTLLSTVITNLLRNALHYTDQGGIKVIVSQLGFRVEDTGVGISGDQHQDIFLPYVRGTHARGEGMGVGLSLVKRICEYLAWDISVKNIDSGGSCFMVNFINEA